MGFIRKYILRYVYSYLLYPILVLLFPRIKILNSLESIRSIDMEHKSLVRFGDGEFSLMMGDKGPAFQKGSPKLAKRLSEVMGAVFQENLLICVPEVFDRTRLSKEYTNNEAFLFWRSYIVRNKGFLSSILSTDYVYGNAQLSRPYMDFKNQHCEDVFVAIRALRHDRKVVIVEGEKTRFGVGNDLLAKASSISRIICPAENAFDKYEEILNACLKCSKDNLFILALGPTAKPLVLDLSRLGYQALDLGHLDIEYEWFLRKVTSKIAIPDKWVNETREKYIESSNHYEDRYESEVIARI